MSFPIIAEKICILEFWVTCCNIDIYPFATPEKQWSFRKRIAALIHLNALLACNINMAKSSRARTVYDTEYGICDDFQEHVEIVLDFYTEIMTKIIASICLCDSDRELINSDY